MATTFDGTFDSTFRGATVSSITLSAGTRTLIQAYATKDDYRDSATAAKTITVYSGTVATPVISQTSGQPKFTIACDTAGATIRYTTDGTTPSRTVGSTYSGEVTAEYGDTIKAFAYKDYWLDSAAAEAVELTDGYSYTNQEAATYVAALTTAPDDTDAEALDTFVGALKAAGVFAKLDSLKLLANWDETGSVGANSTCMFNLIDPTKFKGTVIGTGGVTHTQYTGIYGNGTAGINDGFNPTTAGIHATQDSLTYGCWRQNKITETGKYQMGMKDSTDNVGAYMICLNSGVSVIVSANHNGGVKGGQLDGGMATVIRSASNSWRAMKNGTWTAICSGTDVSSSPKNINYAVLTALTKTGDLAAPSKDTLALSFIGEALTQTEFGDLYAAVNTFLTALFARAA